MKQIVFFVLALPLIILTSPDLVNAQHCPSGVQLTDHNIFEGSPSNSHVVSSSEGGGYLPDPTVKSYWSPNASSPLARRANRKVPVKSQIRYYKVFVMEKEGTCYKVANSDLGRTMYVSSEDQLLDTETYYELCLRKLNKPGTEAEAPENEDCGAEWEVINSEKR